MWWSCAGETAPTETSRQCPSEHAGETSPPSASICKGDIPAGGGSICEVEPCAGRSVPVEHTPAWVCPLPETVVPVEHSVAWAGPLPYRMREYASTCAGCKRGAGMPLPHRWCRSDAVACSCQGTRMWRRQTMRRGTPHHRRGRTCTAPRTVGATNCSAVRVKTSAGIKVPAMWWSRGLRPGVAFRCMQRTKARAK